MTEIRTVKPKSIPLAAACIVLALTGSALADTRSPGTDSRDATDKPRNIAEMLFGVKRDAALTGTDTADASPADRTAPLKARIAAHARAAGIPVDLAEAVVAHESRFNPKARGSHGEVGLMQIKPQTARGLGYRGTTAGLYDIDTNLTWGMAYLAAAYKLADGDMCGTILRYNAGHGARRMTAQARGYCSAVRQYVAAL